MVEFQSCGTSLVNASAFSGIEEQVNRDSVRKAVLVEEISADLQRERRKNAELIERISLLEAQLQNKDSSARGRKLKKFKRQKMEPIGEKVEDGINISRTPLSTKTVPVNDQINLKDRVSLMSIECIPCLNFDKVKDGKSTAYLDDREDDNNENGNGDENLDKNHINIYPKEGEKVDDGQASNKGKNGESTADLGVDASDEGKPILSHVNQGSKSDSIKDSSPKNRKENVNFGENNASSKIFTAQQELRKFGSNPIEKRPKKIAFCPKEVNRIMELEDLSHKNAQSHTIRKIIAFASLGIQNGCEDMHELDFTHFSILRKGEPYLSPQNPGEHVLYEKSGVRKKIFYPNRRNPTLCPIQILEDEKAMRPLDYSCPSCLFLCIKYGGRTRNLPQNEYVRQQMGIKKLKSFGADICRMAMLVHVRSGSFFFKAFGITLLFMAGFVDDLVKGETKYRNLDLLKKYYRTDEDAEGEELFLSHSVASDTHTVPKQLTAKTISTKSKRRKNPSSIINSDNSQKASTPQPVPSKPEIPIPFGLTGYVGQNPTNPQHCTSPFSHPIFPPLQTSSLVPLMYFPSPNGFLAYPFRYFPIHPQDYYDNAAFGPLIPNMVQGTVKHNAVVNVPDCDSYCSSSNAEPKAE